MTTDVITHGTKDTTDGCVDDEGVIIVDDKTSSNTEDSCNKKVIDEKYRYAVEKDWEGIVEIPENWNDMTVREQRDWTYLQVNRHMPNLPKSLSFLIVGKAVSGDCGRSEPAPRPDWLDHEKFLRGQRFAMNNLAFVFFAELVSLVVLFSFEHGLKPLIITNKSSDPYTAFKRYLSTGNRVKNWYSSDPWTEGTAAYKDIQTVRRMHGIVRKKLMDSSFDEIDQASKIEKTWSPTQSTLVEDFRASCPASASGQCPYLSRKDEQYKRPVGMNQTEMAATQSGFICFTILYPEYVGIHGASDDDLDDFCHVWRSLGYLLGMEDEFNFCDGTLEEVKQRSRDFLEYFVKPNFRNISPEWEHMLRCVMTGVRYYFPSITYEHAVLYVADMLNIQLPRFEASLSFKAWLRFKLMKLTLHWTTRLPWVPVALNRRLILSIERGLNYTQQELEEFKKLSTVTLSEGIEKTATARQNPATTTYWQKNSYLFLFTTCLLLSLPVVVKKCCTMFFLIGTGTALIS